MPVDQNLDAPSTVVRHAIQAKVEPSTCGTRHRLLSHEDQGLNAWAHTVDLQDGQPHYHKIATELYYVLEGEGTIRLGDEEHSLKPGSIVHIPPGVVHGTKGRMKALVVGIPDIRDEDVYFVEREHDASAGS